MKSLVMALTLLASQFTFAQLTDSAIFTPEEVPATMEHDNCKIAAKPNDYLPLTLTNDDKKILSKKGYTVQEQYLTQINEGKNPLAGEVQMNQLYLSIEQIGRSSSSSSGNSTQIIYGFGSTIYPGLTVEAFQIAVANKKEKKIQRIAIESLPACILKASQ